MPLHMLFLFFSVSGVLAKYASFEEFLSIRFVVLCGAQFAILFVYSVLWQFVLRGFPLTMVYANRSVTTIWGLLWGVMLFDENISLAKVIAAMLIISGIVIVGKDNV